MKRFSIGLMVLLMTLLFSATLPDRAPVSSLAASTKKVRHLPPIYVTIPEIPDCDPLGKFPQMILLPHFMSASQIVPVCHLYDRNEIAWALTLFYRRWEKEFGDPDKKILGMVNDVMINWGMETKTVPRAYNLDGVLLKNPTVIGLAISPTILWSYVGDTGYVSDTSFVHELVHLSLWSVNGHADADHEGDKYDGWTSRHTSFVHELNSLLRTFNI